MYTYCRFPEIKRSCGPHPPRPLAFPGYFRQTPPRYPRRLPPIFPVWREAMIFCFLSGSSITTSSGFVLRITSTTAWLGSTSRLYALPGAKDPGGAEMPMPELHSGNPPAAFVFITAFSRFCFIYTAFPQSLYGFPHPAHSRYIAAG